MEEIKRTSLDEIVDNEISQKEEKTWKEKLNQEKVLRILKYVLIYSFLVVGAVSVIFPFYWMISTSLKSIEYYYSYYGSSGATDFLPKQITFQNYAEAWQLVSLGKYMVNTLVFSVITTSLLLVVSVLAAFAFARLEFYGKEIVFTIYLATMMIPMELFTITNYATIVNLNLRDTLVGLVMPSVMSVFYVYLLRQNFQQVPDEIYHAAKMDGTSDFKYMLRVLVPINKPTIISIAILKFIECWNSYVWPRLVTTKEKNYLISNGIEVLRTSGFGRENIPAMMAAVVCVCLPLLIMFIIFRNQIMNGVAKGGTKG